MGNDFDLVNDNRTNQIYTKEQLMAPLLPGMEAPPHPMRLGDDEKDYYVRGAISPVPGDPRVEGRLNPEQARGAGPLPPAGGPAASGSRP